MRDECLSEEVFASLAEARTLIERWRIDYNLVGRTRPTVASPRTRFATTPWPAASGTPTAPPTGRYRRGQNPRSNQGLWQ